MAKKIRLSTTSDRLRLIKRMVDDYRAGRLTNSPRGIATETGAGSVRLAKVVTAEIAANAEGDAQLQKADWTDSVEAVITVRNDHSKSLAVGQKIYVRVIQNKWRVIWPTAVEGGGGETTSIATLQEGYRPVITGDPGNPVCDALIGASAIEVDFTETDWRIPVSAGTKIAVQSGPGLYTPVGLIPDLASGVVVSHTTDGHAPGVDTYTVRITYKTDMSSGTSTVDLTVRSFVEPKLINTTLASNTGVLVGRNHDGEWGIVNAGCA